MKRILLLAWLVLQGCLVIIGTIALADFVLDQFPELPGQRYWRAASAFLGSYLGLWAVKMHSHPYYQMVRSGGDQDYSI